MSSEEPERRDPKRESSLEASRDILAKPEYESMQHIDRSLGDAQLAGLELQREAHEEQNRKQEARQNDSFFITQLKTNWTQRTGQLRQNINALYAREREAERFADQAKSTLAPAAPSPATPPSTSNRRCS